MGIPVFITPVEPEVASKASEKIASGPRSSIRRRSTFRGPHVRLSAESHRRRMVGLVENRGAEEYVGTRLENAVTTAERFQARRFHYLTSQNPPTSEPEGRVMPPVPEPRDAIVEAQQREIQRLRQTPQGLGRMARRHPAPTPPYNNPASSIHLENFDAPRPSSSTPARTPDNQLSRVSSLIVALEGVEPSTYNYLDGTDHHHATINLAERVHVMRQASLNMDRATRLIRLDGLGDRNRSLSPEGPSAWDTLLANITPDPQSPGSSFASTSAAAHVSSSNPGPASASTSMPSLGRTDSPTLRDCISDSGSDTDEEEEDMYELQNLDRRRTREDSTWSRTSANAIASRRPAPIGDQEHLGGMHRIISRLAERDEIPDEWWASAGLSRNLRREPST